MRLAWNLDKAGCSQVFWTYLTMAPRNQVVHELIAEVRCELSVINGLSYSELWVLRNVFAGISVERDSCFQHLLGWVLFSYDLSSSLSCRKPIRASDLSNPVEKSCSIDLKVYLVSHQFFQLARACKLTFYHSCEPSMFNLSQCRRQILDFAWFTSWRFEICVYLSVVQVLFDSRAQRLK